MMKIHSILICITFLILWQRESYAQTSLPVLQNHSQPVMLYFRFDRTLLEKDYLTNAESLDTLRTIMTNEDILSGMDSIVVKTSASPEGDPLRNLYLSEERAAAVKSYLMWQYPYLDEGKIQTFSLGENWDKLRRMVDADLNVPYRNEVLTIIDSNLTSWSKDEKIRQVGNGATFDYMVKNMFRYLRSGATCIVFFQKTQVKELPEIEIEEIIMEEPVVEALRIDPVMVEPVTEDFGWQFKRPIALKTNLLFDLASVLNVEVEIPLGSRFSIAGEWIFPWWLWERQQNSLEVLSGTLEGRYWIKPNYTKQEYALGKHNPLAGWFTGLYSSMGKYDLEWKKKGYQGEVYVSCGLSFGYVKPLSRNLNMEFSLSAGYVQSDYRHYMAQQDASGGWHLIKQYPGTFRWIGPTKVKVSFVWYPHFKSAKKGGMN